MTPAADAYLLEIDNPVVHFTTRHGVVQVPRNQDAARGCRSLQPYGDIPPVAVQLVDVDPVHHHLVPLGDDPGGPDLDPLHRGVDVA